MSELINIAKNIQLLILDCDGVLTDGKIYYDAHGEELLAFHVRDGYGIEQLQAIGVPVAVISGRKNNAAATRLQKLKIAHIFLGQSEKTTAFHSLLATLNIHPENVAYIGDDLPDFVLMQKVGLPIAVADAVDDLKKIAMICTKNPGGNGAVREICDLIIHAKNK
jgi:3-deoxy-D-manno-octulosonate 8-phosphate phosphatase (KDO 8-P phosphatase)